MMHVVRVDNEVIACFVLLRHAIDYSIKTSEMYPTQTVTLVEYSNDDGDPIAFTKYIRGACVDYTERPENRDRAREFVAWATNLG